MTAYLQTENDATGRLPSGKSLILDREAEPQAVFQFGEGEVMFVNLRGRVSEILTDQPELSLQIVKKYSGGLFEVDRERVA